MSCVRAILLEFALQNSRLFFNTFNLIMSSGCNMTNFTAHEVFNNLPQVHLPH